MLYLSIKSWGRIGKVMLLLSTLTILFDLIGYERLSSRSTRSEVPSRLTMLFSFLVISGLTVGIFAFGILVLETAIRNNDLGNWLAAVVFFSMTFWGYKKNFIDPLTMLWGWFAFMAEHERFRRRFTQASVVSLLVGFALDMMAS